MANTTYFGWETPDDTDLVKDGAAAIRTLGQAIDTSMQDLEGGTTGQILAKNSNADMDFVWVTNDVGDITEVVAGTGLSGGGSSGSVTLTNTVATEFDAKGDLVVGTGADTFDKLSAGTNDHRLVAASGETTGLKYVADTQNTVIDAEGDLLVGDAADTIQRLAIGSNAQVLTVDTTVDGKIKWATPSAGATFVGVQVTKTANTSVGAGANVQIPWDSEEFDTDGFHSNVTNNARLTVPSGLGGYYKVYFAMQWASSSTVQRRIVAIYKNGNSSTGTFINNFETSSINFPSCAMAFTMNLSAADWIEIDAYQGTASALDFRSSNAIFGMEKIG